MPKFSIITPVYLHNTDRVEKFKACIQSVANQSFKDFEHVVVNDGSIMPFNVPDYGYIKVINQPNLQRLNAYNAGFKNASGEIFCVLDSDDQYEPDYLQQVYEWFNKYPKYKMFNFGCKFVHKDGGENFRGAFKPKKRKVGHEVFGGGNIVNGTFVFHRSIYDEMGAFPEGIRTIDVPWYKNTELFWTSPYDFSAYAQVEFPEIQKFFKLKHPDHPKGLPKELGNPWGQDYYLFYKYTRKHHSKPFDRYLYIVYLR